MSLRLGRICSALAALILTAGATSADSLDAQEQIDRMLDTLGGREAIDALRSLAVEADCTGPGGEFHTRVESFLPGSTFFEQSSDDGTTAIWSTAERTWQLAPDGGAVELPVGVRYFVRSHEFHLLLFELETRFRNHSSGALDSVDGRPCRRIEMEDESGQTAAVCLAVDDALPLLLEMNPEGAEGPIRIVLDDWRTVAGLRYFFSFVLTEGPERTFTYAYDRIAPNEVVADHFVAPVAPPQRADQEALIDTLRLDRRAHLESDAGLIASHLAGTLVEVADGNVAFTSRSEVEFFFSSMFEGATFTVWEDTQPPVIRLSDDSSMAWVVRRVRARREAPEGDGEVQILEYSSAYTATYEKRDGEWLMTSVTSTFLPP